MLDSAVVLSDDSDPGDLWRRYDSARIALVVYLAPRVEAGKPPPRQIVGGGWQWIKGKARWRPRAATADTGSSNKI
jgi:hypothetical protein